MICKIEEIIFTHYSTRKQKYEKQSFSSTLIFGHDGNAKVDIKLVKPRSDAIPLLSLWLMKVQSLRTRRIEKEINKAVLMRKRL